MHEFGSDNGSLYLNLRAEAERMTLFDSLPKELLASDERLSRSLLTGIIGDDAIQISEVFH